MFYRIAEISFNKKTDRKVQRQQILCNGKILTSRTMDQKILGCNLPIVGYVIHHGSQHAQYCCRLDVYLTFI